MLISNWLELVTCTLIINRSKESQIVMISGVSHAFYALASQDCVHIFKNSIRHLAFTVYLVLIKLIHKASRLSIRQQNINIYIAAIRFSRF